MQKRTDVNIGDEVKVDTQYDLAYLPDGEYEVVAKTHTIQVQGVTVEKSDGFPMWLKRTS